MSNQYRLLGLGNSELLAGLSALVREGNALTARVLAHLMEFEERMLHLELGFSSLFSYCVEALGMSEGAAGRRVTAARVCRRFPEAFERVARGELHLCALCALAPRLTSENAAEFFEVCGGKTRRQIEELVAARFPRPDVREQIRRLPARARVPVVSAQAREPSPTVEASSPLTQQSPIVPRSPAIPANSPAAAVALAVPNRPRRDRGFEPLASNRFGVHFTADAELRDLIEHARALASHRVPNGDLASLMKLMVTSFVQQEEKRRFGVGANQRRTKQEHATTKANANRTDSAGVGPPGEASALGTHIPPKLGSRHREAKGTVPRTKQGRYLPVRVRRETHDRDGGRCAFVSADRRRCNARAFVQFDHIEPFARRGAADARNIRLLCRAHNLLHARHCFGARHLAAKIAAKKALVPRGNAEL